MLRRIRHRYLTRKVLVASILTLLTFGILRPLASDLLAPVDGAHEPEMRMRRNSESHVAQDTKWPHQETTMARRKNITTKRSKLWQASNCETWFGDTFEDNLRVISKYPRGVADKYLRKIDSVDSKPRRRMTSFPVIATAANSGFYDVSQGLLKSIHKLLMPKYGNITIVYYDMGLQNEQRVELEKYCRCEVRTFPFDDLPGHVRRVQTYTWKPIIVKKLLTEFGFVWWMDSSVRFVTSELDSALDYSRRNSVLFFTYAPVFAVAQNTDQQTMKYLQEDTCKFRSFGEIEATFLLFNYDHVTKILTDVWAACALNENCMCPPGTSAKLACRVSNKADGRCHRFDQSVISILLRRLYHDQNDYPLVDTPFHIHEIHRGERVQYFKTLHSFA